MRRVGLLTTLALLGCASGADFAQVQRCASDDECGSSQVCFPDGCGDPGRNIVVEVVSNTRTGHHAQDFLIESLAATQNVEVYPSLSLYGEIARWTGPATQPTSRKGPYTQAVTIYAEGESELIPGTVRRYQTTLTPERGAYTMQIGAGKYTVTAAADDVAIPFDVRSGVLVRPALPPANQTNVNFLFQAADGTVVILGTLYKRSSNKLLVDYPMTVQAFDPMGNRPLSQRAMVQTTDGAFRVHIDPAVNQLETFQLVVAPKDFGAPVPTKKFPITRPFPQFLTLELGDYGTTVPATGQVVASDKKPVAGARVTFEGVVGGGGTYKSRTVLTDADGRFRADVLPPSGPYSVLIVPPSTGFAGMMKKSIGLKPANGTYALDPAVIECPDRVPVLGTVTRPDGTPGANVPFTIVPVDPIEPGKLLPPDAVEGQTDENGRLSVHLDPAVYRVDFVPLDELPRWSQILVVRAETLTGSVGGNKTIEKTFTLLRPRRVTGMVEIVQPQLTSEDAPPAKSPAANASLRFFHVSSVEGKRSSLLLGTAVTDDKGRYSVVLPVK